MLEVSEADRTLRLRASDDDGGNRIDAGNASASASTSTSSTRTSECHTIVASAAPREFLMTDVSRVSERVDRKGARWMVRPKAVQTTADTAAYASGSCREQYHAPHQHIIREVDAALSIVGCTRSVRPLRAIACSACASGGCVRNGMKNPPSKVGSLRLLRRRNCVVHVGIFVCRVRCACCTCVV